MMSMVAMMLKMVTDIYLDIHMHTYDLQTYGSNDSSTADVDVDGDGHDDDD